MDSNKKFLLGIYDDEDEVLQAVSEVKGNGVNIHEVYTPFPVHGLDKAIGHPRTRIPIAAFLWAVLGTTWGTLLTVWTMGYDWPMNIGGKDDVAFPAFVPIIFEATVLTAAYGMAFTFFASNGLWPGKKPVILDIRSTDDKFVLAVDMANNSKPEDDIAEILRVSGAIEVNTRIV